ncbi:hypothetical protein [Mesorhizobium sp. M0228]|uniref:hypothetical protein n=1 Tax=Mesorhizobium sp. M0228 TaxID=2956923 RepID=UPI0033361538
MDPFILIAEVAAFAMAGVSVISSACAEVAATAMSRGEDLFHGPLNTAKDRKAATKKAGMVSAGLGAIRSCQTCQGTAKGRFQLTAGEVVM